MERSDPIVTDEGDNQMGDNIPGAALGIVDKNVPIDKGCAGSGYEELLRIIMKGEGISSEPEDDDQRSGALSVPEGPSMSAGPNMSSAGPSASAQAGTTTGTLATESSAAAPITAEQRSIAGSVDNDSVGDSAGGPATTVKKRNKVRRFLANVKGKIVRKTRRLAGKGQGIGWF